jgi:branched-chain amino acid transport system ATP-binding protein
MLELQHITAGYGDSVVLRGVDLHVVRGEKVALLGPNGAGKTTLLRVVAGLLKPRDGTVLLDGTNATTWPTHRRARRGLCLIPEGRGIFSSLTVRENLLAIAAAGSGEQLIEAATSAFPSLGARLNQIAGTLSGGEQQMLALSRTYVAPAHLVLVDEVSTGLGPKVVDGIFGFLDRLAQQGTSLLIVEQYIGRALELCDRVYLLNKGMIDASTTSADLDRAEIFRQYVGVELGS